MVHTFGLGAIAQKAWRLVMPPVIEFGGPVWREVDAAGGVWHVPVSIRPWWWFGSADLDGAEVYLDRWSKEARVDSVPMNWGDLSETRSEKTWHLQSSRVAYVPFLRTLPDGRAPLITDRRFLEKQIHSDWRAADQEFRYRLRIVAIGYERQSEEFYYVHSLEKHPSGGRDGYLLDCEFGGVSPERRRFRYPDMLRIVMGVLLIGLLSWVLTQHAFPWALSYWSPHDGDPAETVITISSDEVAKATADQQSLMPQAGATPFGVNVHYIASKPIVGCSTGHLATPTEELSAEKLDEIFRVLVGILDVSSESECSVGVPANDPKFSTLFVMPPSFLTKQETSRVLDGTQPLYVFYVWRYTLEGLPLETFIREHCVYFFIGEPHSCAGDHDATFFHVVH
ncbi:MAG: hypothetical protein ABSD74_14605 [Rhizomicrobium sp.]|jgi:hypothetical protein